jgi:hypothetical protein
VTDITLPEYEEGVVYVASTAKTSGVAVLPRTSMKPLIYPHKTKARDPKHNTVERSVILRTTSEPVMSPSPFTSNPLGVMNVRPSPRTVKYADVASRALITLWQEFKHDIGFQ